MRAMSSGAVLGRRRVMHLVISAPGSSVNGPIVTSAAMTRGPGVGAGGLDSPPHPPSSVMRSHPWMPVCSLAMRVSFADKWYGREGIIARSACLDDYNRPAMPTFRSVFLAVFIGAALLIA